MPDRPVIHIPQGSDATTQIYDAIPGVMVVVTHEEVYGSSASWSSLADTLAGMVSCGLLLAISKLNSIMFWEHYTEPRVQRGLATELFVSPERETVMRLLRSPDASVFSEEQLLGLAKQAILLAKAEGDLDISDRWPDVLKAALMVSELMTLEQPASDDLEDYLPLVVRSLYFNRFEAPSNLLARYSDLLLYRPNFEKHKTSPNWLDLRKAFEAATEMHPFDFLAAGRVVYGHFGRFRRGSDFARLRYPMRSADLGALLVNAEAKAPFLAMTAKTVEQFKKAFGRMPSSPKLAGASNLPFFQSPLVSCGQEEFFPVSLARLMDALSVGVYWRLHSHYASQGKTMLHRFTSFLGELFQDYVYESLERTFPPSTVLARRLWGEIEYGSPKRQGADATIVYGDTAVFLEASSGRMRYMETVVGGTTGAIDEDIDKCIVDKAAQLDRVISDFRHGELVLDGVRHETISKIYPVLVLLEHFPLFIITWRRILDHLAERGILTDTEELRVISVEELERLEPLLASGVTLKQVLEGWANTPAYSHQSLKNYLLYAFPDAPFRAAGMEAMFRRLNDTLKSHTRNLSVDRSTVP